jgi:hypothetical protein
MQKTEIKDSAKHTQRRKEGFEWQTTTRICENIKIKRAVGPKEKPALRHLFDSETRDMRYRARKIVYCDDKKTFLKKDWKTKKFHPCTWEDTLLEEQLKKICHEMIDEGHVTGTRISFFTEFFYDNVLYRADPFFSHGGGEPWYDWAKIQMNNADESVPGKLLIFMDLSDIYASPFTVNGTTIDHPGMFAITYALPSPELEKAHTISLLVDYGELQLDQRKNPKMFLIDIDEQIVEPLCAVPYSTEENTITARKWLFVKTRRHWYRIFCDHLENFLIKDNQLEPLPGNQKPSSSWQNHVMNPCNQ